MPKAKRIQLELVGTNDVPAKEDNRVFCRFALSNVPVRFKDLKIGEKGDAVCKDISGGGAGIAYSRELKPRTPLEMWFDLPDGFEPLHLLGKVVWSQQLQANRTFGQQGWNLGISFDRPKLVGLSRILKLEPATE